MKHSENQVATGLGAIVAVVAVIATVVACAPDSAVSQPSQLEQMQPVAETPNCTLYATNNQHTPVYVVETKVWSSASYQCNVGVD